MTDNRVALLAGDSWLGSHVEKTLMMNGDAVVYILPPNPDEFLDCSFLKRSEIDWIVTAYWPYLLSPEAIATAKKGTVNLHPSLLPLNRGWYPYVHNILDGSPAGVTLHEIAEKADCGRIWAQDSVPVYSHDTAFTLRRRLRSMIAALFEKKWPAIAAGEIEPQPQDEQCATYHARPEVLGDHELDPKQMTTVGALVRVLRARSFGKQGFAYYEEGGQKVYLNLRLSPTPSFGEGT